LADQPAVSSLQFRQQPAAADRQRGKHGAVANEPAQECR
jgi:hypothetical protein